jgi:hypothetical protein
LLTIIASTCLKRQQAEEASAATLKTIATDAEAAEGKLKKESASKIAALKADLAKLESAAQNSYDDKLQAAENSSVARKKLGEEMAAERRKLETELEETMTTRTKQATADFELEVAELRRVHQSKMRTMRSENGDALEQVEIELKAEQKSFRAALEAKEGTKLTELQQLIQTQREACDREEEELRQELQRLKDAFEVESTALAKDQARVEKLRAENQAIETALQDHEGTVTKLTEQAAQLEVQISQKTAALQALESKQAAGISSGGNEDSGARQHRHEEPNGDAAAHSGGNDRGSRKHRRRGAPPSQELDDSVSSESSMEDDVARAQDWLHDHHRRTSSKGSKKWAYAPHAQFHPQQQQQQHAYGGGARKGGRNFTTADDDLLEDVRRVLESDSEEDMPPWVSSSIS